MEQGERVLSLEDHRKRRKRRKNGTRKDKRTGIEERRGSVCRVACTRDGSARVGAPGQETSLVSPLSGGASESLPFVSSSGNIFQFGVVRRWDFTSRPHAFREH